MPPSRIGILGGTFDPPHRGHVDLARAARAAAGLDRVLFVVAARPPFKDGETHATAVQRAALLEATLADAADPGFELSRLELERSDVSYTIDTVDALAERYPAAELFFIAGSDTTDELPQWKDAAELARRLSFIVNLRAGEPRPQAAPAGFRITFIEGDVPEVSSSELRAKLAAGEPVGDMISPATLRMIEDRGLYGKGTVLSVPSLDTIAQVNGKGVARVRERAPLPSEQQVDGIDRTVPFEALVARITEQLEAREDDYGLRHSLGCADCCAQMALVYGLDESRAYLAGLLHDWDRCVPKPELIEEARALGFDITPEVLAAPAILHAHTGAAAVAAAFPEIAREAPEIITAIERHTVGVPDMGPLDELLYVADMIEPTRRSPNIADLREMVGTVDLDALFMQAYQRSMAHLVRRRKVMHPDTIRVWNALVMRGEIGQDLRPEERAQLPKLLIEMDPGAMPEDLENT